MHPVPNRPFALRGHVTSFLWKWKWYDFAFEKRLVGHILNKIMVIWFFIACESIRFSSLFEEKRMLSQARFSNPHHFLKMSKFIHFSWSRDQNMIFKIMNYLSLNTNFALKLQGKCWKDDVIMCSADHPVCLWNQNGCPDTAIKGFGCLARPYLVINHLKLH